LVDFLPPLFQAAAAGQALYHSSSDAHTNVAGNRIIAATLDRARHQENNQRP
jgi:hypothetical protein